MGVRAVSVTGMGIVTAAGIGKAAVWRAVGEGVSGLRPLSLFPSERCRGVPVGEVREDLPSLGAPPRASRGDQMAFLAGCEALEEAGLTGPRTAAGRGGPGRAEGSGAAAGGVEWPGGRDRIGIILGATVGGMLDSEEFATRLARRGEFLPMLLRHHEVSSSVDLCAGVFGIGGPCAAISTACSSSALAIAAAACAIEAGEADAMLAGGADSLCRLTVHGFDSLLLLDRAGCRPFDAGRAGLSIGEGAAVLVLEAEEAALARGARILARLSGWGATCDAYHVTAPRPDGDGALAAMRQAIEMAGIEPGDIGYVNAHGTGTKDNDLAEARALRALFRDGLPPVSSTKGFFGHVLGGSGAIEAVVSVMALLHGRLPPNAGFSRLDPEIGFEPLTAFAEARPRHVLSNSFGFGGNNVALVFSHPSEPVRRGGVRSAAVAAEAAAAGSVPGASAAAGAGATGYSRPAGSESKPGNVRAAGRGGGPETGGGKPRRDTERAAAVRGSGSCGSPAGTSGPLRLAVVGLASAGPVGTCADAIRSAARCGVRPSVEEIGPPLPRARMLALRWNDREAEGELAPARRRRLNRLQQMAVIAARRCLRGASEMLGGGLPSPDGIAIAVGTGLGCLGDTSDFLMNLIANDEKAPMPAKFVRSVHNSLSAEVAIEIGARGPNSAPTQHEISFEAALWQVSCLLAGGAAELAVAGAGDEISPCVLALGRHWRWWPGSEIADGVPPAFAAEQAASPAVPAGRPTAAAGPAAAPEGTPVSVPAYRPAAGSRACAEESGAAPGIGGIAGDPSALSGGRRPVLPGEGVAAVALTRETSARNRLALLRGVRIGRATGATPMRFDAAAEARWISETLESWNLSLQDVDIVLYGAPVSFRGDPVASGLFEELRRMRGSPPAFAAYGHLFGAHPSVSAFGFAAAVLLVRGEISPADLGAVWPSGAARGWAGRPQRSDVANAADVEGTARGAGATGGDREAEENRQAAGTGCGSSSPGPRAMLYTIGRGGTRGLCVLEP
ncbi:MAG: beta-ketoacyl-[acyl-carrier-protein] synthase family protein [Planctomycetota bacterium]|nr:beta-ketoacyl-[acyl-carrier-protein] synthase family protein [Planctomycetota bacterium]